MVEKRRLYLGTEPEINFVDGVAVRATKKGDVISFVTNPEGGLTPEFPGIPREEVLKSMDSYKRMAEIFLNTVHDKYKDKFLKLENLPPCLKEVHRLFGLMIDISNAERVKERFAQVRDLVILALYEDTSYRWALQYIAKHADMKKLELSDDDKFWFKTRSHFAPKY